MIRLESVTKAFPGDGGDVHAIRALDLEVRRGETLCLIGASGCGKTTTLRLINRLEVPSAGRVLVDGADIAQTDPIALRRRMGYVIQSGGLFPHMTVAENVGLLCRLEGWDAARVRERVDGLLERVHLEPERYRARYPRELSGGQRQRVGIARALALDPDVMLMDEPFGALDPITRMELREEFGELERDVEKTIVLVTHDLDEAFALGDRVALMADGALLQVGTRSELEGAPASDYVERFLARRPAGRTT